MDGAGRWSSFPLQLPGQLQVGDPFIANEAQIHLSQDRVEFIHAEHLKKRSEDSKNWIYLCYWDPRFFALHFVLGTIEPASTRFKKNRSSFGEIPDSDLLTLSFAFNGGFQSAHGKGGVIYQGSTLIEPVENYATIEMDEASGRIFFGTWKTGKSHMDLSPRTLRQNLKPLLEEGVFNPQQSQYWGGLPPGSADGEHTVRSALCLTHDRFMAYAYSKDVSPAEFAEGLKKAGCTYAMQLDINKGQPGFEFYRIGQKESDCVLGGILGDNKAHTSTQTEDTFVGKRSGFTYCARRLYADMRQVYFPRYIKKDSRDFFYVTLRSNILVNPLLTEPF